MNRKTDYKTIMEIIATAISIILMKIGNGYLGTILFLLTVLYDIIIIVKNYLNKWQND